MDQLQKGTKGLADRTLVFRFAAIVLTLTAGGSAFAAYERKTDGLVYCRLGDLFCGRHERVRLSGTRSLRKHARHMAPRGRALTPQQFDELFQQFERWRNLFNDEIDT